MSGTKEDKKLYEKVLSDNEKYYTLFRKLIEVNRLKGRDHEILCDYLECRENGLMGNASKYLFYDQVFSDIKSRVVDRVGEAIDIGDLQRRNELTKNLIQEWVDKKGHNQCWYYPEIFIALGLIHNVDVSKCPELPPREEFSQHCKIYEERLYDGRKE
ncbi:MAG: hypothetical protein Q7S27_05580 [Nanoarchaeota archaeon]|nr:hypothetical protein [Nanoarchaeota archaeon]